MLRVHIIWEVMKQKHYYTVSQLGRYQNWQQQIEELQLKPVPTNYSFFICRTAKTLTPSIPSRPFHQSSTLLSNVFPF